MTSDLPSDPIKIILEFNQTTAGLLDRINQYINTDYSTTSPTDNLIKLESINDWFKNSCPAINHALEQKFFPALLESMAGSDAICIKGMTSNYINSSKKLDQQWQYSIYSLLQTRPYKNTEYETIKSWLAQYRQALSLCSDEIVPMADRLLDGLAIQELGLYFGRLHTSIFK